VKPHGLPVIFLILSVCLYPAGAQGQAREGLPGEVVREIGDLRAIPSGRYRLEREWEAEGPMAAHQTGRAIDDPEASGGRAWELLPRRDSADKTALYGPYLTLTPGVYVALFRLKAMGVEGEERLGQADAVTDYAQTVLSVREIFGGDLPAGQYGLIPLAFRYSGGKLECRLTWSGYLPVRIDRILLYRVENPPPVLPSVRAPEAVPSGQPSELVYRPQPRPFPEIFPRSAPPAPRLAIFDTRRLLPDEQLLVYTLQGLVNRSRPELYCLTHPLDQQWLDWLKRRRYIRSTETIADLKSLLARYRHRFQGAVVTDPKLPASVNVATMLAGVRGYVVLSPRLSRELALPVREDLRGRWRTSVEAYRWAFDHLWSQLNHHVLACSYPDHLALRDYLVQHRIFIFWISGPIDGAKPYANPTTEARLMEQLFAKMPVNIPVMSYPWAAKDVGIGEGPGVTLFAEFGKYLVGSINCSNLSVHSGVRIPRFTQKPAPPAPKLSKDKVYVSWIISDGDNLPVLTLNNFPQLWREPVRGSLPLGWTISPSAAMLIPGIVDYYYATATPADDFLAAVSGVGYTYADSYAARFRSPDRQRIFDGFLEQTRVTMERMDLQSLWIMNATRPEAIRRYAEKIPRLEALFPDYGRRVAGYEEATYPSANSVPVFHALTQFYEGRSRQEQIRGVVEQIRSQTPTQRPAFMHLFVLNWFADLGMLKEISDQLGSEYGVVRPDHLAQLYRQHLKTQKALIRAPAALVSVEGQPAQLTATLQNVTTRPMATRLRVSQGLRSATVHPQRIRLAPGQAIPITLQGVPTGTMITLIPEGAAGASPTRIRLQTIPAQEILPPALPQDRLEFVRQFPAVGLLHRSGIAQKDPHALTGTAWTAQAGRAETGFILFGPYTPMPEGRYLVLFRLKRMGSGSGRLLTLDSCVGGGVPVTAQREVLAESLPDDEYRTIPLSFTHPGGALEMRVQWWGGDSVAVDCILLWRIAPERRKKNGS
jgi:hypothetical protein